MSSFSLFCHTGGPVDTNSYLLICSETKQAVVIDPSFRSEPSITARIVQEAATLSAIWLTHSHWDHIIDCGAFRARYGESLPIGVHFLDEKNLSSPGSDGLPCPYPIEPQKPAILFREGDLLQCGNLRWTVLHTPGHSPGSVLFLNEEKNALFTGDTLFQGTYGNISFPTSCPDAMKQSLKRLYELESDPVIYPGHGNSSRLSQEKLWLRRFACDA